MIQIVQTGEQVVLHGFQFNKDTLSLLRCFHACLLKVEAIKRASGPYVISWNVIKAAAVG
ncbi:MAG: hypothetical protein JW888_11285 [Pirellulales bacterium]|nr:hypothetical protein [Pirellulales bacterium]